MNGGRIKLLKVFIWSGFTFAIIIVAVLLSRNELIKLGMQKGVRSALGIRLTINKIDFSLIASVVRIEGITIYNPMGFKEKVFARISLLSVDYETRPLFEYILHCSVVEVNIKKMSIVTDEKGVVNINHLKADPAFNDKTPGKVTHEKGDWKEKDIEVKIDKLILCFDQIIIEDYSRKKSKNRNKIIKIDRIEINNIKRLKDIIHVVVKVLEKPDSIISG